MSGKEDRSTARRPTESELEILQVLWSHGPSSVRQVHDVLSKKRKLGYTTVLKFLQIMAGKGLVRRNEEQRAHVYEAFEPASVTKRQLAGDLLDRVFEGSAHDLMLHALGGRGASEDELEELRQLIDRHQKDAP